MNLDPPVLYLNHDEDSSIIAPDLARFLLAWERLAYVGPDHWLLLYSWNFLHGGP